MNPNAVPCVWAHVYGHPQENFTDTSAYNMLTCDIAKENCHSYSGKLKLGPGMTNENQLTTQTSSTFKGKVSWDTTANSGER